MKKYIIYIAIISLTMAQTAFSIEEKPFGHDKKLNQPTFEDLQSQFYVPAKKESEEEQQKNENLTQSNFLTPSSDTRNLSRYPLKKLRLKVKKSLREHKYNVDKKKHPEKYENIAEETIDEPTNQIMLECETMDYLADKKEIRATGGAKLTFPKQNTVATADEMIYNQKDGLIKMINNVVINRDGSIVTGDYMQVNMNDEISMIDNMRTENYQIEMKAQKGYMMGDKTIQENGRITADKSFRIKFSSGMYGNPNMELKKEDEYRYSDNLHSSKFLIKSNHIIVNSKKDHDTITLKQVELYKDGKRVLKMPSTTFYTNKSQDYVEGNYLELGSKPKLGIFAGPGWVMELPKGSTFKVIPMLNYSGGIGIGGMGRFRSASNMTELAYGSAANLFTLKGKQELDENLYVQYGSNAYLDDGFIGSGWAKYAADLIYEKSSTLDKFLGKKQPLTFTQRISAGYIQDDGKREEYNSWNKHLYDKHKQKLYSNNIGTSRFRYMLQAQQTLYKYENYDKLLFSDLSLAMEGSAAIYGTGDTQFIGRIGPKLRTQCKYWVQELGYYQSAYSDDSPITIYDAYRYGKSNVYIRESVRLNKLLMLSWYGSLNLSGDAPDERMFQESRFVVGIGPDDIRLNLGLDVIRQNTYIGVTVDMDAKGTVVDYDKMEIKNPDRMGKTDEEDLSEPQVYVESKEKPVKLTKCQVFDIEDESLRMENEKL